jgi:glycosyltransferase involved in cell wall biosynthesis
MPKRLPRITIVSINYNMRAELEQTIRSVAAQTYPNLEYIVVDGASNDGSQGVIDRYAGHITRWISEPDKNLYDAMNKGVEAATGEWLLFMNSGDYFVDDAVVTDMFANASGDDDFIYGNVRWRYPNLNLEWLVRAEAPDVLPYRMFCSHQSLFSRTALLRENPMDLSLLIADYDFLMHMFALKKRFRLVDRVVASIARGGRSDLRRQTVLRQEWQVRKRYGFLTPRQRLRYPFALVCAVAFLFLRESLPSGMARWLVSWKLRLSAKLRGTA